MSGDLTVLPHSGSGSGFITAVADTATIDLTVLGGVLTADLIGGGGDITDGANVGGFAEVFRDKTTTILNFRTLQSSDSSISITQNADDLDLTFNGSITGTPNTFSYFDGAGDLQTLPGWAVTPANFGSDVQLVAQMNNAGGGVLHNWISDLDALQDSPNESWVIHNFVLDLDENDAGFDLGSATTQTLISSSINYNPSVSSVTGSLVNHAMGGVIGDGSTAVTLTTLSGQTFGPSISNAVTLTNLIGMQLYPNVAAGASLNSYYGYDDQASIDAASSVVTYRAFTNINSVANYRSYEAGGTIGAVSSSYLGVDVHPNFSGTVNSAYGIGFAPTFSDITNSYTGFNFNPAFNGAVNTGIGLYLGGIYSSAASAMSNIAMQDVNPQFQSGSSVTNYTDFNVHATFQSGSNVGTYKGLNLTPSFQAGATASSFTGVIVNPSTTSGALTSAVGLDINMSNVQMANPLDEPVGLSINNGRIQAGVNLRTDNNLFVDSGNLITPSLIIDSGSPITGTDVLMTNLAGLLFASDDLGTSALNLGSTMVGFVGNFTVAATKTVSAINCALGGAGSFSVPGDGGNIVDFTVYKAVGPINGGGATTVTNSVQFLGADTPASIASNNWGVRIDADYDNWFKKNVVVGGSSKQPTNSSVGVEVAGTTKALLNSRLSTAEKTALTAVNGMQTYDTDLEEFQFYQNGSWTGLGSSVNYLIPNEVTNNSWVKSWSPAGVFATAADGESSSAQFDGSNSILFEISLDTGESLVISASNALAEITAPSDASDLLLLSDAGTGIYVSKSAASSVVTVKNRMGGSRQIGILAINSRLTSVSAWA